MKKEKILAIINDDVPKERQWKLEAIIHSVYDENKTRLMVLIYDTDQFLLWTCVLRLEKGKWQEKDIIPIDWDFVKIGFAIYLFNEIEDDFGVSLKDFA
jgi:hypothetical protein